MFKLLDSSYLSSITILYKVSNVNTEWEKEKVIWSKMNYEKKQQTSCRIECLLLNNKKGGKILWV